jgi:NodT family efflux transporter outer membrane factor (OMF) lipoprotein
LKSLFVQAVNRLGVLLGEHPAVLHKELAAPAPISKPPAKIIVGLPTELLRQRPDIRRAERELAAQTARIGVAKTDLYPRFSLSGTFALEAYHSKNFFDSSNRAGGFGPSFNWNVFQGGRILNSIKAQEARTEQALLAYEQTVLDGLEEVENAMVAYAQEVDRRDALERSVTASRKSVDLVETLYRTGLTDFQNLLDMQRSQFQQEDQLAESDGDVVQYLIRIYKSLGGGWAIELAENAASD